jgi:hypothetical protein
MFKSFCYIKKNALAATRQVDFYCSKICQKKFLQKNYRSQITNLANQDPKSEI